MKIAIASDQAGFPLKEKIRKFLAEQKIKAKDFGTHSEKVPVDYPDYAYRVARAIKEEKYERGILICGMGIGMQIAANKVPGIYAARCHDPVSARKARESNNAQILTLGSLIIGEELAKEVIRVWLASEYQGRSDVKIAKIRKIEGEFSR